MKELSIIAAVSDNNVIGKKGHIPWYIPEDLKRFKKLTLYRPVIMGRKTYESIIDRLGKPLPKRINIVLTRQQDYKAKPKVRVLNYLDDVIVKFGHYDPGYVIGGQSIYEEAMSLADRLEITEVHQNIKGGDAFFPKINKMDWKETNRIKNEGYDFVTYEKRSILEGKLFIP